MGYIDIHFHVLPDMDDGAKDMETALEMLRIAQAEGIRATPENGVRSRNRDKFISGNGSVLSWWIGSEV